MSSARAQTNCRFTLVLGSSELPNCSHWTYPLAPNTFRVFLACPSISVAVLKLTLCIKLYLCQLSVYEVCMLQRLFFFLRFPIALYIKLGLQR